MIQNQKITKEHLKKIAIVYLRQSTYAQVIYNKESQSLQYQLVDRAKELGWLNVEVIDEDLGVSASQGKKRQGFRKLVTKVANGEVGIIFSREASRLSRTDKDWCQLFEICKICQTLIGDDINIYDLALGDDQLVMGIKATLSVAELGTLKARLIQGMENKAKRGELYGRIAPGYICVDGQNLVKDPDKRVQEAIMLVFRKFSEVSSVRQLMKRFHEEQIELPVNKDTNGKRQLIWQLPKYSFLKYLLQNPTYAGAYFYGRTETKMIPDLEHGIKKIMTYKRPEEARVFIRNHHEGYISWEEYEENQKMIQSNNQRVAKASDAVSAIREGHGLLTGLLRCGRCGRKLHVRYWGKSGTAARYLCDGDFEAGGKRCLGFGGASVDKKISKEILRVIEPLTLEASLEAIERIAEDSNDRTNSLELQIKQAEYEAQRAFEQYDQVDPRNRLVADQLEKRWNDKLILLGELREQINKIKNEQKILSNEEKKRILDAGKEFPMIWNNEDCSIALKKKIVRLLIKEIIVDLDDEKDELHFLVHWHGGVHTELSMKKPLSAVKKYRTSQEDLSIICKMAVRYRDDEIARVLSKLGRTTAKGLRWNESRVAAVRKRAGIPAVKKADNENILTLGQAVKYTGVSDTSLIKLIKRGILKANQVVPYAPLEIDKSDIDSDPVKMILDHLKSTGKLVFDRVTLPEQRLLFE